MLVNKALVWWSCIQTTNPRHCRKSPRFVSE